MTTLENNVLLSDDAEVAAPLGAVYAYWLEARKSRWAPGWEDFHLDSLPPDILPWSVVVDVVPEEDDFVYRFWGTERAYLIGAELTGKHAADIPTTSMREANIREYVVVRDAKKPMLCQTPVVTATQREAVFTSLRLPISDDGETVTKIYSAIDHQQISAEHYEYFGMPPRGWR